MIPPPSSLARPAATITRERRPGLDVTRVCRRGLLEAHITLRALRGERPADTVQRLVVALEATGGTPVHLEVFGALDAHGEVMKALEHTLGRIAWPVTWTEETDCPRAVIGGMHLLAVAGAEVRPVGPPGGVMGCAFEDDWARYCVLGGVFAEDLSAPAQAQASQLHERLFGLLQEAGMGMSHVARSCFALANLSETYSAFQRARGGFYRRHRLGAGLASTSTCLGARNPAGAAVMAGLWAIRPLSESLLVQAVPALKAPAREEGGCAAQAVEITSPDHRRLLISAGAGLNCTGQPGGSEARKQVDHAMRAVGSILAAREFSLLDVSRATVRFKHASCTAAFTDWCVAHDALFLPVLVVQSGAGGRQQLVEIELDAITCADRRSPDGESSHAKKRGTLVPGRRRVRTCKRGFRAGPFPAGDRS